MTVRCRYSTAVGLTMAWDDLRQCDLATTCGRGPLAGPGRIRCFETEDGQPHPDDHHAQDDFMDAALVIEGAENLLRKHRQA